MRAVEDIAVRGSLRAGELQVVNCGSRLKRHAKKCVFACLLSMLSPERRASALSCFAARCANGAGSGLGGLREEARNMRCVISWLQDARLYVWVYESEKLESLESGEVTGRWRLGCREGGNCVGSLVWLRDEAHVVRLLGDVP